MGLSFQLCTSQHPPPSPPPPHPRSPLTIFPPRLLVATRSFGMEPSESSPGYTLSSPSFSLTFLQARQLGEANYALEYETDWQEVMAILLSCLALHPSTSSQAAELASSRLEAWALLQQGGDLLQLRIRTRVKDKPLGIRTSPTTKTLTLEFSDPRKTTITFEVVRRRQMMSLKRLGAAAVVENLRCVLRVDELELPMTLLSDLQEAQADSWRSVPVAGGKWRNLPEPKLRKTVKAVEKEEENNEVFDEENNERVKKDWKLTKEEFNVIVKENRALRKANKALRKSNISLKKQLEEQKQNKTGATTETESDTKEEEQCTHLWADFFCLKNCV